MNAAHVCHMQAINEILALDLVSLKKLHLSASQHDRSGRQQGSSHTESKLMKSSRG